MNDPKIAKELDSLVECLYPFHRSMTGEGVRKTFDKLAEYIPLTVHEVPTGTKVFDWTVPKEWRIRDAFIADQQGNRLVDYADSNLHVVNGSVAVNATMNWAQLASHVHSLPDRLEAIPYRTAYYSDNWGFCIPHSLRSQLADSSGSFHVCIDADHFDGSLTYAECTIPGNSDQSVLIYCHTCHPSLANDNLSGIAVATALAQSLLRIDHHLTYRFVFAPATIGAIAWLARNESTVVPYVTDGLVLSLLGSDSPFTYKRSRQADARIDKIAGSIVKGAGGEVRKFRPFGYDERQFCSPGFNMPVGCLSRKPHSEFPEYHTSDDNLAFVSGERMAESLRLCESILTAIEESHLNSNATATVAPAINEGSEIDSGTLRPISLLTKCEPFLKRFKLHDSFGMQVSQGRFQEAIMWVLSLSDGSNSIRDIAVASDLTEPEIATAVERLRECKLLMQ